MPGRGACRLRTFDLDVNFDMDDAVACRATAWFHAAPPPAVPLGATAFPNLFTHSTQQNVRVASILRDGLVSNLRNRLSSVASQELVSLLLLLQDFMPLVEHDERFLHGGLPFTTKTAYKLLSSEPHEDPHALLIWSSRVPSKVKVFAWLLFRARLNCKANLYQKHISPDSRCPCCNHHYEDTDHIFLHCPLTCRIWQRLGILMPDYTEELWDIRDPVSTTRSMWPFILLLFLWKIWAARNAMTFCSIDQHSAITINL
ncbi:myosin-2 heavy chain [Hordeum vulgare]|nr:myosin-2 heavy chain [Hordeum vulgare]